MPRPQPLTNSCPKAAPPLKRHALSTAVVQPPDHVDGRLRYGTLINDRPVQHQSALQPGDWIRLGPNGPVLRFLGQQIAPQQRGARA